VAVTEDFLAQRRRQLIDAIRGNDPNTVRMYANEAMQGGYPLLPQAGSAGHRQMLGYNRQYRMGQRTPPMQPTSSQGMLSQLWQRMNQQPADPFSTPYGKAYQQAQQQAADLATRKAMEYLNQRGILNSTIAGDRAAQIQQQYMTMGLPGLIQQTQASRQQDLENMFNFYGLQFQQEQQAAAQQDRELDRAWQRVQMLGYVDNIASITLGIPAGTPSYQAQQTYEARKHDIRMQQMQNQAAMQRLQEQMAYRTPEEELRDQAAQRVGSGQGTLDDYSILGIQPPAEMLPEEVDPNQEVALALAGLESTIETARQQGVEQEELGRYLRSQTIAALKNGLISHQVYSALMKEINAKFPFEYWPEEPTEGGIDKGSVNQE